MEHLKGEKGAKAFIYESQKLQIGEFISIIYSFGKVSTFYTMGKLSIQQTWSVFLGPLIFWGIRGL